jgi:alpha-D-ribose 1-methylphosphonate 5-phosphate C-P lyase
MYSAYPALVQTLSEIFETPLEETTVSVYNGPVVEFLMSWNRRIAETSIFFDLMHQAGFSSEHLGKCIYSFKKSNLKISSSEDEALAIAPDSIADSTS